MAAAGLAPTPGPLGYMRFQHQRGPTDCSICCAAMALRQPYERILEVAGSAVGWDGLKYETVFAAFGFEIDFQPRTLRPRQPAIIAVPSRLNKGRWHAVFYEEGRVYDPTVQAAPYSLGAALVSARGFFQWRLI